MARNRSSTVLDFPILGGEQTSPGVYGANRMAEYFGNMLKNRSEQIGLPYKAQTLEQLLREKQLANEENEIKSEYTRPTLESELQKRKLANLMGEKELEYATPNLIAALNASRANTAHTNLLSQLMPQELNLKRDTLTAKQAEANKIKLGDLTAINNIVKNPETIAAHPELADFETHMLNKFLKDNPDAMPSGYSGEGDYFKTSPEVVENFKLRQQIKQNKDAVSLPANKRADAAVDTTEFISSMLDQGLLSRQANAAKYAGQFGKGKQITDKFKEKTPLEYQDYVWFKDTFVPAMSQRLQVMEGLYGTKYNAEKVANMINSVKPGLDYDSSKKLFKDGLKLLDETAKSAINAAEPIHKGVRLKAAKIDEESISSRIEDKNNSQNYTQEELEYAAKLRNISVDEVKRRLGTKK